MMRQSAIGFYVKKLELEGVLASPDGWRSVRSARRRRVPLAPRAGRQHERR